MARATKEVEVEQEEAEEAGLRSRMYLHEGLVEHIRNVHGVDLEQLPAAEIIAWAFAKRNEYRKTDEYRALVEEHKGEPKAEAPVKKAPAKKAAATKAAPVKKAVKKQAARAAAAADEDPFA